jgi:hypothetical protein
MASGDLHVLDLDGRDLDAPGLGLLVDDLLEVLVEALALRQQLVELGAPEHRAQGGLRYLRGGWRERLDLRDRRGGVDDPEVADGRDPGRGRYPA